MAQVDQEDLFGERVLVRWQRRVRSSALNHGPELAAVRGAADDDEEDEESSEEESSEEEVRP